MADQALWSHVNTSSYLERHMDDDIVVTETCYFCLNDVSANPDVTLWGLSLQIWCLYSGQPVEK